MSSTGEPEPTRSRPSRPNPPPSNPSPPNLPQWSEPTRAQPIGQPVGQPAPPYAPVAGPAYVPPAGGQPPRRTGGKNWLWALGGVLVASLAWGGVLGALLLTGTLGGGSPGIGDYAYADDLCESIDYEPFDGSGFTLGEGTSENANPGSNSSEHDAIDSMSCYATLSGESEGSTAYHYTWTELHKETDPAPEFEARYLAYEDYEQAGGESAYDVEELSDLGDQAFLVTQTDEGGEYAGGEMILGVLDGGLTYQGTWNSYSSAGTDDIDRDELAEQLREVAESTMDALED